LTDPKQAKEAVNNAISEFGTVHGLVNNAGVNDGVGLENGDAEQFINSLKKNLVHYFVMAKACLPYLKENKGAIVNIGSKVSVTGQGRTSAYAAACGGRNALTREWAVELLPHSVRVNTIMVAESLTPLYKKWINTFANPEEKLNQISNKIPLEKRMTTPEEIANTVVFLMSEKSSHTTGQLLYVDGGYVHLDRSLNTLS
jgi:NAD(P)-dependent dehydrogenase (short-subunit alcohol dehydrogenase family)